jgi:hypothetical protein
MHHTQIWILVKKIMTYEDVTSSPEPNLGFLSIVTPQLFFIIRG